MFTIKKTALAVLLALLLVAVVPCVASCGASSNDEKIVGTYLLGSNPYTFTADGKILTGDETDSASRYTVKGKTIYMYSEGEERNGMSFPLSFDGEDMLIGEAEYQRVPDLVLSDDSSEETVPEDAA